jgi:hypothetical protein
MEITAKITIPNKPNKYLPNAVNYKGFLCQEIEKGVGTPVEKGGMFNGEGDTWEEYPSYVKSYRVFFNSTTFEANGLTKEEVKAFLDKNGDIACMEHPTISKTILKWGENPNGYIVEDMNAANQKKEENEAAAVAKKEIPISAFRAEYFGIDIRTRLPKELFSQIKPFATYWNAEEINDWFDDMDYFHLVGSGSHLAGWYYKNEAIDKLIKLGYKVVNQHETEIKSANEL